MTRPPLVDCVVGREPPARRMFATTIDYDLYLDLVALFIEARKSGYSFAQGPLIEARGEFFGRVLALGVGATRNDIHRGHVY